MDEQERARVAEIEARWEALATTIPSALGEFLTHCGVDMGFLLALVKRLSDAGDDETE